MKIIKERYMIRWMPILTINHHIEVNAVEKLIYNRNDFFTIVFRWAIAKSESSIDKIVLNVDN